MKDAFIRFLNLKNALKVDPADLDLTALRLLEICEMHSHTGQRLTVTQAMCLTQVASPATIHRKLTDLLEAGYLSFEYDGKNRRTKYLTPTSKSHDYFTKLGSVLKQSSLKG
jgi:DNA-binding MarR family transcriptional regulator